MDGPSLRFFFLQQRHLFLSSVIISQTIYPFLFRWIQLFSFIFLYPAHAKGEVWITKVPEQIASISACIAVGYLQSMYTYGTKETDLLFFLLVRLFCSFTVSAEKKQVRII